MFFLINAEINLHFEVKEFTSYLEIKVVVKSTKNAPESALKSRIKSTLIFEAKFMSCLEIKVVSGIRKNCLFEIKVKFTSCIEIKVVFKMRLNPLFITTNVARALVDKLTEICRRNRAGH